MIVSALSESRSRLPEHGEGWQSEQSLHELEELRGLVPLIEATVQNVLEFLEIGETAFEITACWANILPQGASHRMHSHPNNFLSGVYYAVTREGADTINFHDPRPQTGIVRPPMTKLTEENTDQVVVKVKDGTLLVFPSWLPHSVDTNKSSQQRISVSFNVMFSDYTEKMSKPLWRPRMESRECDGTMSDTLGQRQPLSYLAEGRKVLTERRPFSARYGLLY
jgi:uncharacterized protein (TIGR02466 family)